MVDNPITRRRKDEDTITRRLRDSVDPFDSVDERGSLRASGSGHRFVTFFGPMGVFLT